MTARAACRSITEFVTKLLEENLSLTANVHKLVSIGGNAHLITWSTAGTGTWTPTSSVQGSYEEYLEILRNRQFSAVLNDGAILQVSYLFRRDQLAGHRLCYYPCPVHFLSEELSGLGVDEFLELLDERQLMERIRTRPTLRFEYDPERAAEDHPASHLHMAYSSCRIPVCAPLSFGQFTGFVFRNFYPEIWKVAEFVRGVSVEYLANEIERAHAALLHIAAVRPA